LKIGNYFGVSLQTQFLKIEACLCRETGFVDEIVRLSYVRLSDQ